MKMFAIRDTKSEGFNTPFFQQTFGLAERAFKDACDDPQTSLHKHKEDFALFYLGDFDQTSGELQPIVPKHICNAM